MSSHRTGSTFNNTTQFVSLRGFGVENDEIKDYVGELDKYSTEFGLGNVIWPSYPIMFAKNLGDLADEIKRRGLFLFDIWGYVPGLGARRLLDSSTSRRAAAFATA